MSALTGPRQAPGHTARGGPQAGRSCRSNSSLQVHAARSSSHRRRSARRPLLVLAYDPVQERSSGQQQQQQKLQQQQEQQQEEQAAPGPSGRSSSQYADEPASLSASLTLVPKAGSALAQHGSQDPLSSFFQKCKRAWNVFFPDKPKPLSAKEAGKQRLSMILVADRCGLSPQSLLDMKRNTVKALAGHMDVTELEDVQLRFTMVRQGGTTYSMAVPVGKPGIEALDAFDIQEELDQVDFDEFNTDAAFRNSSYGRAAFDSSYNPAAFDDTVGTSDTNDTSDDVSSSEGLSDGPGGAEAGADREEGALLALAEAEWKLATAEMQQQRQRQEEQQEQRQAPDRLQGQPQWAGQQGFSDLGDVQQLMQQQVERDEGEEQGEHQLGAVAHDEQGWEAGVSDAAIVAAEAAALAVEDGSGYEEPGSAVYYSLDTDGEFRRV